MYDKYFARTASERAIKTFAQTLVATVLASATDIIDASIPASIAVALGASVLSVLTTSFLQAGQPIEIIFSPVGVLAPEIPISTASSEAKTSGSTANVRITTTTKRPAK